MASQRLAMQEGHLVRNLDWQAESTDVAMEWWLSDILILASLKPFAEQSVIMIIYTESYPSVFRIVLIVGRFIV